MWCEKDSEVMAGFENGMEPEAKEWEQLIETGKSKKIKSL